jgi:predicted amidophosphoribosyltransferase
MNTCDVCGKPIPRTNNVCEDCENGITIPDMGQEEFGDGEEFGEDEEY